MDNQYAFAVGENVLIRYGLYKGEELNDELQRDIQATDQQDRAYNLALNYLSHQLRTVYEVNDYLQQHEVAEATINAIIKRLLAQRYLMIKTMLTALCGQCIVLVIMVLILLDRN